MIRRLALTAALAAGALVASPVLGSPAGAATPSGQLVFVKNGDVWVSRPDGSGQVRVTTGGGYADPSMSDTGRIAAIRDHSVVVLRPDGAGDLSFRCQVDSSPKRACTSPQAFTRLKPGKHTVKVWATDAAGNTSAAVTARFTVRS